MSWWTYVQRVAPNAPQAEIAAAAGVTASTVSRWGSGKQGVDAKAVITFARGYGRPVLEALVAAGLLTPAEAKERPTAAPSIDSLTDEQLLDEIRRRLDRGNTTPMNDAPQGGAQVHDLRQAAHDGTPRTAANRKARATETATQGEEPQE